MGMKCLIRILIVLCVTNMIKCETRFTCVHQDETKLLNPFVKIRGLFNVTWGKDFSLLLYNITYNYYDGVVCEEKDVNSNISRANLNVTELITILNINITDGVKETDFINMATVLLLHVFSGKFCMGSKNVISQENSTLENIRIQLVNTIVKSANATDVEAADLEELMKKYFKHYTETDSGHKNEHRLSPIKDNCVSSDLLLEQLGHHAGDHVQKDEVGNLAALLVYHIIAGSKVTERCRNLPRPSYFIDEIFKNDETMTEEYFLTTILGSLRNQSTSGMTVPGKGHDHKRRRRDAVEWTRCFSGEELLSIFSVMEGQNITKANFSTICPALVHEKIERTCESPQKAHVEKETVSDAQRYGYGTVAVVIVCLCSILGAIFLPLAKRSVFQFLMEVFKGLAVGTLVSDPILHLLPEVLGVHDHETETEDGGAHLAGPVVVEEYIWFGMVTLGGIYLFYLLELIMTFIQVSKSGSGNKGSEDDLHHSHNVEISVITKNKTNMSHTSSQAELCESANSDGSLSEIKIKKEIAPLALMVIFGDAIHNFADGLAIGAAFTQAVTVGVATTIAVFCHELPHELGDFAVLLNSGFTVAKAIFWNLMSSLTALIGLYIGLGVSVHDNTRKWIFSVTSGLFLYIALTDLLPELLHKSKKERKFCIVIQHNIGIFLGTAILILLAIFEERINF